MSPKTKKDPEDQKTSKTTGSAGKKKTVKKSTATKTAKKKSSTKQSSTTEKQRMAAKPQPSDAITAQAKEPSMEDFDKLLSEAIAMLDDHEDSEITDAKPASKDQPDQPLNSQHLQTKKTNALTKLMAQKTQNSLRRKAKSREQKLLQARRPHLEILSWRDATEPHVIEHNNLLPKDRYNPFLSRSSSSWPIQYWAGNAEHSSLMSSSIGLSTYRGIMDDDTTYRGTWRYQAFVTAVEIVVLAQKQGWPGIRVIDGCHFMIWAAWTTAHKLGIPIALDVVSEQEIVDAQKAARADHLFTQVLTLNGVSPKQQATATATPMGGGTHDENETEET